MNKITILIAIVSLGLLPGLNPIADAQHCRPQSQVFISGHQRCGTPTYRVRYVVGYDRCGRPIWRVRELNYHERRLYYRSPYAGYCRHTGSQKRLITYTASGGRGHTTICHLRGFSTRCR